MSTPPWERFSPSNFEPEPELPYIPANQYFEGQIESFHVKNVVREVVSELVQQVGRTIENPRQQPNHHSKEMVSADARNRSWRTLIQGLAIDLTFALFATLAVLSDMDPFVKETWVTFGILLGKTVIQTAIAYFMRMRVTPTIHQKGEKLALVPVPEPVINKVRNYQ